MSESIHISSSFSYMGGGSSSSSKSLGAGEDDDDVVLELENESPILRELEAAHQLFLSAVVKVSSLVQALFVVRSAASSSPQNERGCNNSNIDSGIIAKKKDGHTN